MMFGSDFSSLSVAAEDHVGFDLCVMATSDHSIITYGKKLQSPELTNYDVLSWCCHGLSVCLYWSVLTTTTTTYNIQIFFY